MADLVAFIREHSTDPLSIADKFKSLSEDIISEERAERVRGVISSSDKNVFFVDPSLSKNGIRQLRKLLNTDGLMKNGNLYPFSANAVARKYNETLTDGVIDVEWRLRVDSKEVFNKINLIHKIENVKDLEILYVSNDIHPDNVGSLSMTDMTEFNIKSMTRTRGSISVNLYVFIKSL